MIWLLLSIFIILPFLQGGRWIIVQYLSQILILICGLIIVIKKDYVNKTQIDFFIVILFLWCIISTFFSGINFFNSTKGIFSFFSYICLFYIFLNIDNFNKLKDIILTSFAFIGTLFSLYVLYRNDTSINIFTNINHFALFQAIAILAFYKVFKLKKTPKLFIYICFVSVLISFFILKSRGAFIGLWISILFGLIILKKKYFIYSFILISILAFSLAPSKLIYSILKFDSPIAYSRTKIYKSSLDLIKERYIFGTGLNNFEQGYKRHKVEFFNGKTMYGKEINFAHNELVNFLAETGIPSFVILFMMVLFFIYKIKLKNYYPLIFVSCILFHSMFDFVLHLPLIMMILIFTLAWFIRDNSILIKDSRFKREKYIVFIIIGILGFISLIFAKPSENKQSEKSIEELNILIKNEPYNPFGYKSLADMYYNLGRLDKAKELCKKALKIEPYYFKAHYLLGLIHFNQNRYDSAQKQFNIILNKKDLISKDYESPYEKKILFIDNKLEAGIYNMKSSIYIRFILSGSFSNGKNGAYYEG